MGTRIEIDLSTGDAREVQTTPYFVAGVLVLIDEGQPVPFGAVLASSVPEPVVDDEAPRLTAEQADKVIEFLKANPDILAAAQL